MADVPIDIDHVSMLARLPLTPAEKERFSAQFGRLFQFIGELQQLDVEKIEATAQVIPLHNAFRDDIVRPSLDHEAALANAPDREGDYFKTPRILE
ncbi:MAG TPA: Asp-tRNA(Asn)/Glu-tRNA(Gln) amidotransferase subunit GatC [Candidatus Eremiobacteraceae bacterium]|nr:Asp-tRNA(Asn)/Glu-tRNA(Gln) amidotransferase subunit GatC [Candidatus Eremiobacteraceae bacterium]